jgi:transposase
MAKLLRVCCAKSLRPRVDQEELGGTTPRHDHRAGERAAESMIAEIGVDMSVFPTAPHRPHLASWAGRCPGNNVTGSKRR